MKNEYLEILDEIEEVRQRAAENPENYPVEKKPLVKCAIWRNHEIIGYCELTEDARQKANGADNAIFYFGLDRRFYPKRGYFKKWR